jgi:hypothetical protein
MITSNPFQRRKCDRLLAADDLSRREICAALAKVAGLESWILESATTDLFVPTSIDAVLVRAGTTAVRGFVSRFFEEPEYRACA